MNRREVGEFSRSGELVETVYEDDEGNSWFPGVETVGEGIFIHLKEHILPSRDKNWDLWLDANLKEETQQPKFHPLFVWWHSMSHRIISSLSVDSGYSSASIRERIYINVDKDNANICFGGAVRNFLAAQSFSYNSP